jgi:hypothetical protein
MCIENKKGRGETLHGLLALISTWPYEDYSSPAAGCLIVPVAPEKTVNRHSAFLVFRIGVPGSLSQELF